MQEVMLNVVIWNEDVTEISYAVAYLGVAVDGYIYAKSTTSTGVSTEPMFIRVSEQEVLISENPLSHGITVMELHVPQYLGLNDPRISIRPTFNHQIMTALKKFSVSL